MPDWKPRLRALAAGHCSNPWAECVALANARISFVQTNALDEVARRVFGAAPPAGVVTKPVRLAILGASTLSHLHAGIRVAGFRRGLWIDTYEGDYNQYLQDLIDPASPLHEFRPDAILLALDAYHLTQGMTAAMSAHDADAAFEATLARILQCWQLAREHFRCPVLHQASLSAMPDLLGSNEHRMPGSPARMIARLNAAIRPAADREGVDILALDAAVARFGIDAWHDRALWHRSKQEISPAATPLYGDLVGRLLAAKQGRSFKCLVMDLDNTLWGGVIGDDGLDGIVLGQGSALGEAFVAVQRHAQELGRRGIILAVSSKNDEANVWETFDKHPEMVLRRTDIACFRANWNDKASNIREIARELNIGIDSLVFLDDNPFERTLVREQLPMVAVPEWEDEPALVPQMLADAGYFESFGVTDEDLTRGEQYQSNAAREVLKEQATDLDSYLRGLDMTMVWSRFDTVGLQRTVQLINKTNQFNLTTRRTTNDDILAIMADPRAFGLQMRLLDRFGDNGIIAIVIGRMTDGAALDIDTWLMSCRVLGRQVERTTLNLVAQEARKIGARRLVGHYVPTPKNGMVKHHYENLGFTLRTATPDGGSSAVLDLDSFSPAPTFITLAES